MVGGDARIEGAGWDHVAWRVTGADGVPWIVRAPREDAGEATDAEQEVAVMQAVRRVLGELVADAVVLDAARGSMTYPRLPGVPLQELLVAGAVPSNEVARLAGEIGALIRIISSVVPPAGTPVEDGLPEWYAGLPAFVAAVEHVITTEERAAIDRFLVTPPPPDPDPAALPLAHNDLGAEHVLVDPATLAVTGIIDWSDAARADPAADLGRLIRDLGGQHAGAVLDGMGIEPGPERAALTERGWAYARCLVVEDLAYALEHRPDLVAFEHASLTRLFADV